MLDAKDHWSLKSLFAAPASGEAVAKITASHIRAGMTLSRPVRTLDGVVLLPSAIELSETDKQKLIALDDKHVYVEEVEDPERISQALRELDSRFEKIEAESGMDVIKAALAGYLGALIGE